MNVVVLLPLALLLAAAGIAYLSVRAERGSGDVLHARRAEQPLAHELPYWAFLDDVDGVGVAVNVDLTYSSVLALRGLDTDCLDNEAMNAVNAALHAVLQNPPPGAVLQFLHASDGNVAAIVERYRATARGAHPVGQDLVDQKARALHEERGLRRTTLRVAVSLPNTAQKATARALGFVRTFPPLGQPEHEDFLRRLKTLREQVGRALQAAGLGVTAMTAADLRQVAYEILNPERARLGLVVSPDVSPDGLPPDPEEDAENAPAGWPRSSPAWSDEQSAREQLLLTGVHEDRTRLCVGDQVLRVITLKSLPTTTEPALLEELLVGLPFHCRVSVAVEILDTTKALDDLKRRRDQAHLLATLREKRNQEAEAQEQDVAELIDKNLRSSVRMVRVAVTVVLSVPQGPNADAVLDRQAAEVLRIVSGLHGAQAITDEYNQLDEWVATLPGNALRGRRWRQCTSENAAHLLLAWQSWTGSGSPALLLHNGRGNLVGLDPFASDLDNPNAFMAGSSGSGKSCTTNYLLLNLLATGAKALVVDVGGSYRRILDIFGGQYFAVSADGSSGHALNPFFPHRDITLPDGRLEERRAQFVAAVIERMVCDRARPELGNAERAVLGAAIQATYQRISVGADGRTPILSDLVRTLREMRGTDVETDEEDLAIARTLARDLRVWVEGPAARLVNRPSTVELTTDCAAFDLKGLETQPHLQSVVMLILSGIIWNLVMRDPTERKIVIFDEVWRLLEAPASAALIAELYRTSRKYRTSILTISQSVEDFTSSPIAGALVNNSATTYLLRHRRGHETVAEQFHLNARELHVFQSLEMRRGEYTEALVLHGDHHFLGRIVLSPLEYWIATTHPADLALEQRTRAAHPRLSRLELLRHLAATHPRGAADAPDSDYAEAAHDAA